ncbi:MAG: hypothetical protein IJ736_00985 [Firmicutes bacterium]|nr:hypothetical protein [Bacillota bacterium]
METNLQFYDRIKETQQDRVVLLRLNGFYVTFRDDAKKTSECLGITLTRQFAGERTYICMFPHNRLDYFLPKLIRHGNKVAICDKEVDYR